MLPRHALSSITVKNARVGPWWAATAEISKKYQALDSRSEYRLFRQLQKKASKLIL
jgi:hypothetical protein